MHNFSKKIRDVSQFGKTQVVHVLGNGPSVKCFETNLFHTQPEDGVLVSCNWGHPHLNCVFTSCDTRFILRLCELEIPFTTPIVYPHNRRYKINELTRNPHHLKKLNITLAPKRWRNLGVSSGHFAVQSVLIWYQPSTIHLWGIDSFWTNDRTSIHDTDMGKIAPLQHLWNDNWIKIFCLNPKTQFVIHAPTPIKNLPENAVTEML